MISEVPQIQDQTEVPEQSSQVFPPECNNNQSFKFSPTSPKPFHLALFEEREAKYLRKTKEQEAQWQKEKMERYGFETGIPGAIQLYINGEVKILEPNPDLEEVPKRAIPSRQ